MTRKHTYHTPGYTLIEMLVVIAIISLIMPVLYASILSLYTTQRQTLSQAFALSEATKGVKEVVRDVRSAVYAEDGSLPLVSIATSSLVLYADTDFDGTVEQVRYILSGTTVEKGVIEPTATSSYPAGNETLENLAQGIVNVETDTPLFRYYSASSSEITSSSDILDVRRVVVTFVAESTFIQNTARVELHSSASIRNLKDAY